MTTDTTIIRSFGVLGDSVTTKPPLFTCITFLYFTQYFHSTLLLNFHNKSIRLEGRHFYSHFRDEEAGAQRGKIYSPKSKHRGFPGGAVVESLPANAGDTGSGPGLERSHMPRSN